MEKGGLQRHEKIHSDERAHICHVCGKSFVLVRLSVCAKFHKNYRPECVDPEGDWGSEPPPLENHQAIGFLTITGPDPMENWKSTKLPSQHSMLGHHLPVSKTSFNGVSLVGR